jgi:hypothetical protein
MMFSAQVAEGGWMDGVAAGRLYWCGVEQDGPDSACETKFLCLAWPGPQASPEKDHGMEQTS